MPQPASASPKAVSFASLLAGFASPAKRPSVKSVEDAQDLDGLADDVATISYEQALRSHSRTRTAEATGLTGSAGRASVDGDLPPRKPPQSVRIAEWVPESDAHPYQMSEAGEQPASGVAARDNRKGASVTIRLTQAERAQLHQRATEAGLTISSYLRSCVLEAETLRAQVKEALAQLRQNPAADEKKPVQADATAAAASRSRFFPNWHWMKRPPVA